MKKNIKTIFLGIFASLLFIVRACKSELGLLRNEAKVMSSVVKEDASITKSIMHEKPTVVNELKSTDNALNIEKAAKEESELYKNLKEELKDEIKDRMQKYLVDEYNVRLAVDEIMGDAVKKKNCNEELIIKKYVLKSNTDKELKSLLLGDFFNQKKLEDEIRTDLFIRYSEKYFCYSFSNLVKQEELSLTDLKLIKEISNHRQIKDVDFLKLINSKISDFKGQK